MRELDVRWAHGDDAHGVARVHVEGWQAAYRGLMDQAVLDSLRVDERAEGWSRWIARSIARTATDGEGLAPHRMLVAVSADEVLGWATFGAGRDADDRDRGELAGFYVRPDAWGRGVGSALIASVERELRAEGWQSAYLWVLHGNERAIRFYERRGWRADGAEKVDHAGPARELRELRHVRELD